MGKKIRCDLMLVRHLWLHRRTFLGAGLVSAVWAATRVGGRPSGGPYYRFFNPAEARTAEAVCACLIPADRDPGAREAQVVNFLDLQLTRHLKRHQPVYRRGLAEVESASRGKYGTPFDALSAERQVEVLAGIEENSADFFDLILAHTRQGFYGDPRHGGNRDMASWRMVGLPFPQVRGRQHYDANTGQG